MVKNSLASAGDTKTRVQSLGSIDPLEKEMAAHSSVLAGKSHGRRSLAGSSPWGHAPVFLLGNPTDGGAWRAPVHGVTKSQIRLSDRAHRNLTTLHLFDYCFCVRKPDKQWGFVFRAEGMDCPSKGLSDQLSVPRDSMMGDQPWRRGQAAGIVGSN